METQKQETDQYLELKPVEQPQEKVSPSGFGEIGKEANTIADELNKYVRSSMEDFSKGLF